MRNKKLSLFDIKLARKLNCIKDKIKREKVKRMIKHQERGL